MTECERVHAAERIAQRDGGVDPALFKIERDAVEEFARSIVDLSGFKCELFPRIIFMDICGAVGLCEKFVTGRGATYYGAIYFDPRVLCKWTVCHEFAHWLDPGHPDKVADHNETYREIMIKLVQQGIGEYASWGLAAEYKRHGFRYFFP